MEDMIAYFYKSRSLRTFKICTIKKSVCVCVPSHMYIHTYLSFQSNKITRHMDLFTDSV